jgi:nitroreductase
MDAMTNLLTRNSPRELTTPIPSKEEMHEIYQAALRAPDHAWLRPSRFIEVTGAGLDKLSKIFIEFASNELKDVSQLQMEKYQSAPFRAPMIIILTTQIILLALHAKNYAGIWRTGKFAFNKKIAEYLNLTSDHEVIGYLYVGTPTGTSKNIPQLDVKKFVTHWDK